MLLSRLFVLVMVLGGLVAVPASAQRRSSRGHEAESPERAEAREHFDAGVALMNVENWEAALGEFERSLELFPTRNALFNYGMCQKALFQYVEAMATFERYLAEYSDEAERADLRRLNTNLDELRRLLGEVLVGVTADGATITVDGREVGTSPLSEPLRVVSGRHVIGARLDGFHPVEREVAVTAGERQTVALELRPASGQVLIEANVLDADVFVDGRSVGRVPYRGELPAGDHEVRLEADGYQPQTQTVSIALDDQRTLTFTMTAPAGTDPVWFWTMVGVTAAAGVATAALGGVVMSLDEEYRSAENPTDAQYEEGKNLQIGTDVCLGVTAAAAIAALVLGLTTNWGEDGEAAPSAAMAPSVQADGAVGLAVVGRF